MGQKTSFRPVVLCVLDGWGYRAERENNAIALAETPVWDRLTGARPCGLLATSGAAVGLPEGQMGNSEVGHTAIGAGPWCCRTCPASTRPWPTARSRATRPSARSPGGCARAAAAAT